MIAGSARRGAARVPVLRQGWCRCGSVLRRAPKLKAGAGARSGASGARWPTRRFADQ